MASIDTGKIEIFINGLRADIVDDILTGDNLLKASTEVIGKAQ